jgi:transcriptional regulator with XRE-family HTH domain
VLEELLKLRLRESGKDGGDERGRRLSVAVAVQRQACGVGAQLLGDAVVGHVRAEDSIRRLVERLLAEPQSRPRLLVCCHANNVRRRVSDRKSSEWTMFAGEQLICMVMCMPAIGDLPSPLRGVPAPRRRVDDLGSRYGLHVSKDQADAFQRYLATLIAESDYPHATAFARDAGVSPSAVSRWINGKERPAPRLIPAIAAKLGRPVREMMEMAYPEIEADAATVVPELVETDPLARELDRMLDDESPLSDEDRHAIRTIVDRVIEPYRRQMRRRRPA